MRELVTLLVLLGLTGCSSWPTQRSKGIGASSNPTDEQLDICEVVFRYQFQHNASGRQQNARAYFISIFRKNPPAGFLDRFVGNRPPVKPGSRFDIGRGLLFRVERIERIDNDTVEVHGGYVEGLLSQSGNVYRVVRREGAWVVVSDKMLWISGDEPANEESSEQPPAVSILRH